MSITASDLVTSRPNVPVAYWISEDDQSCLDVRGLTAADALRELLAQCGEEKQAAAIRAGRFELAEEG